MKCRKCKKEFKQEEEIKRGFCSKECKSQKTGFWSGVSDVFYFVGEIISSIASAI
jgi:endogenous inhibitor of DNA gyrase (YacG/DUF329 family)